LFWIWLLFDHGKQEDGFGSGDILTGRFPIKGMRSAVKYAYIVSPA